MSFQKGNTLWKLASHGPAWNKGLTKETDERVRKKGESLRGMVVSLETRRKLSERMKGKMLPSAWRASLSRGQHLRFSRLEEREKASICQKKRISSLSAKERKALICKALKSGKGWSQKLGAEQRRMNISKGNKEAWARMSAEERRAIGVKASLTAIRRGVRYLPKARPNKSEQALNFILDTIFPGQWQYSGDGKIWIGRFNPDFINVNGKKQIIELFGAYWHKQYQADEKIAQYAQWGYRTLVIWENELNDPKLPSRIREFSEIDEDKR